MPAIVSRLRTRIYTSRAYRRFPHRLRAILQLNRNGPYWLYRQLAAPIAFGLIWPSVKDRPLTDLTIFEQMIYSQNGEDGIIRAIFMKIGTTDRFCVEFGIGDGTENNSRYLIEKKDWHALLMDMNERAPAFVKREFITPENINSLFAKYGVPREFDLLSIDLDYNTYWVWKAIEGFHPRVVVVEYNSHVPPNQRMVVPYDVHGLWDGTDYFGASLSALDDLGREKGYSLVACESMGVNAFFVRNDLVGQSFRVGSVQELYRPPHYPTPHSSKDWLVLAGQGKSDVSS